MKFESKKSLLKTLEKMRSVLAEKSVKLKEAEDELKALHSRENEINDCLVTATKKANEMLSDVKIQCALEIERLKIFQAKWSTAYEELRERYHFEKDVLSMENIVVNTVLELERHLSEDFGLKRGASGTDAEKQFRSETERLLSPSPETIQLQEQLKREIEKITKAS